MENLSCHIELFETYAKRKIGECQRNPMPLALKREHTFRVLENAQNIAKGEGFSYELVYVCEMAALYHDVARFDQYIQFGTFRDAESFNHGLAGVRILQRENFLKNVDKSLKRRIFTAIACHNRARLPFCQQGTSLLAVNVTRNADKLDILRIMAEHLEHKPYNPTVILSLPDDDRLCGEKLIRCVREGKPALYEDLRCVNDFRTLLGTWYNDLQFESSRRLYLRQGYGKKIVEQLPCSGDYGWVRSNLLGKFKKDMEQTGRE